MAAAHLGARAFVRLVFSPGGLCRPGRVLAAAPGQHSSPRAVWVGFSPSRPLEQQPLVPLPCPRFPPGDRPQVWGLHGTNIPGHRGPVPRRQNAAELAQHGCAREGCLCGSRPVLLSPSLVRAPRRPDCASPTAPPSSRLSLKTSPCAGLNFKATRVKSGTLNDALLNKFDTLFHGEKVSCAAGVGAALPGALE